VFSLLDLFASSPAERKHSSFFSVRLCWNRHRC